MGQRPAQRRQQEVRRRLQGQVQARALVLRRADLRRRQPPQQRGARRQRRPQQEGRDAQSNGEGRLQIGARQLQVRPQPHPDPELLPAGRGQERRRRIRAQDRRHHRRERPGQARR